MVAGVDAACEDATCEDDWVAVSSVACSVCAEKLGYGEECYLLRIVRIKATALEEGGMSLCFDDILTPNGDYAFDPHFLDVTCWESEREAVHICNEDAEAEILGVPDYHVCNCSVCHSQISIGELVAVAHLGGIILSRQSPDGEEADFETEDVTPDILCARCLWVLNDQVTAYWDDQTRVGAIEEAMETRDEWNSG